SNPQALSIGSGRYVQFLAEISTEPFWEAPGEVLSYEDYVDAQRAGNPWDFPVYDGEYLVTGAYSAWIDDVEIDWLGDDRICVISGTVARKDDYGQIKVSVDGEDLVRVLSVDVSKSELVQDRVVTERSHIEVEPKNTGK
ncbi:MAG: hypothetical protein WBD24_04060, partial [Candidatus Omnitrophota bacterium]